MRRHPDATAGTRRQQTSAEGGPGAVSLAVAGEQLVLLPTRTAWWPRRQTILIADAHWGRSAALRRGGVPVPAGATADDLDRLSESLRRTRASRVVLLGDLLHCRQAREPHVIQRVNAWRDEHSEITLVLVRGNHDRRAGDPPSTWRIDVVEEPWVEPPFVFRHAPAPAAPGFVLAGHVHPLVRLRGQGGQRLRLPCFHFTPELGVLPAFSSLARGVEIRPQKDDRVFVIAGGEVIETSLTGPQAGNA
jgi:DNA ligase-associated metallophosphoesterase